MPETVETVTVRRTLTGSIRVTSSTATSPGGIVRVDDLGSSPSRIAELLTHVPWTVRIDEAALAKARDMIWISTLDIHGYGHRTAELERAQDNLRRFGSTVARCATEPTWATAHCHSASTLARSRRCNKPACRSMTYCLP